MNSLITYDSAYGNTERIAKIIRDALIAYGPATLKQVETVSDKDIKRADLIVIGSPTQGGRPTGSAQGFIERSRSSIIRNKPIAMFDTRFAMSEQKFALRVLMRTIGFAAAKMATTAKRKGWNVIASPIGFIVSDTKGPLKAGETERATAWAAELAKLSGSKD